MTDSGNCGLPPLPDEAGKVEAWRLHVLLNAGYPPVVAEALAARDAKDVDLHHAVELVERGCAPDLAAEILL